MDVGKAEALATRRFGVDSVGRGTARSTPPWSSIEPTSPPAWLSVRRCFFGIWRNSLHFMAVAGSVLSV